MPAERKALTLVAIMRNTLIFISIFVAVFLSYGSLFAQTDSISLYEVKNSIKHTDSLILTDPNHFFKKVIKKETASLKDQKTIIPGYDNTLEKKNGHWYLSTFQRDPGDTIYTISYFDNLEKDFYLIFYYKQNSLIYAKLEYKESDADTAFYKREEFYKSGKLIFTESTQSNLNQPFKKRIDIDLYKQSNKYLQIFLPNNR
jgi:hypothetical protein